MTKSELVTEISKKTGFEKRFVMEVVESLMTVVKDTIVQDDSVYLRGFGSFSAKRRAPKTARNITENTTIRIPARKIPAFKPSKAFIAMLEEADGNTTKGKQKK